MSVYEGRWGDEGGILSMGVCKDEKEYRFGFGIKF